MKLLDTVAVAGITHLLGEISPATADDSEREYILSCISDHESDDGSDEVYEAYRSYTAVFGNGVDTYLPPPPPFSFGEVCWIPVKATDPRAVGLYDRHYSASKSRLSKQGRRTHGIGGPGEQLVMLTSDGRALFVWRWEKYRRDRQRGVYCGVFRNESDNLSSDLILSAERMAASRWPFAHRFFTFVSPTAVKSRNPGYCFMKAGWEKCGRSGGGLIVFEKTFTPPAIANLENSLSQFKEI